MKIISAALIAGGGAFSLTEAQLPPVANGVVAIVLPLLLAWMSAKYGDNRTALKAQEAGKEAAAAVTDLDKAADVFARKPQ